MPHNILITVDEKFVQHGDVMLTSLFRNNPHLQFTVYIISKEETDVGPLKNTIEKYNQSAQVIAIDEKLAEDFKISLHASAANYYRLFMGELLPVSVERVLYLDCDLIVTGDIRFLLDVDLKNYVLGAVPEHDVSDEKKEGLGLNPKEKYFNSGVMVVNVALWRQKELASKTRDFIANHPHLIEYWDQDALNALLKSSWLRLPEQYNFLTPFCKSEFRQLNPVIIHYTGKSKPWQYMDKHPYKKAYYKYLQFTRWKEYKPVDATIGNFLRKYSLVPDWAEKFLSKKHA